MIKVYHAGFAGDPSNWTTRAYNVALSDDGVQWRVVRTVTNNTASVNTLIFPLQTARYVRLDITQGTQIQDPTLNVARIVEVELYN